MARLLKGLTHEEVAKFPKVPHPDESFTWHKVPVVGCELIGVVLVGLCSNYLMYYIGIESNGSHGALKRAINHFLKCSSPEYQTKFVYCAGFKGKWFFEPVVEGKGNWAEFEVWEK